MQCEDPGQPSEIEEERSTVEPVRAAIESSQLQLRLSALGRLSSTRNNPTGQLQSVVGLIESSFLVIVTDISSVPD